MDTAMNKHLGTTIPALGTAAGPQLPPFVGE